MLPFMIGMVFILTYCIIALIRIIAQLPKEDRRHFLYPRPCGSGSWLPCPDDMGAVEQKKEVTEWIIV